MSIVQTVIGAIVSSTSGGGGGGGGFNGAPIPGNGSYLTEWPNSAGWSAQGSPYTTSGGISSIPNQTFGWRRTTEQGIWSNSGGNDNPSIFNAGSYASYDTYGGFGTTSVSDNYCCEWKGYLQAPANGVYNFLLDSDDVAMFWIGDGALNPESINPICTSNNSNQLNINSEIMTGGMWYPIRMRYQEWSGNERCQIFFGQVGSGTPLYAMSQWTDRMGWNGGTLGY
jgi:hypothetical protein